MYASKDPALGDEQARSSSKLFGPLRHFTDSAIFDTESQAMMHTRGFLADGDSIFAQIAEFRWYRLVYPVDFVGLADFKRLDLGDLNAPFSRADAQMIAASNLATATAGTILIVEQKSICHIYPLPSLFVF